MTGGGGGGEASPPSAAVASMTKAVLGKLRSLITLDCVSTARLIRSVFPSQFSAVLVELKSLSPIVQYRYLEAVIYNDQASSSSGQSSIDW